MKYIHFLSLPLLLLIGCTAANKQEISACGTVKNTARAVENTQVTVEHPRIILDNGKWKLSLVPDTMGGFDRFYNEQHPHGLFWGISYSKIIIGGLLERNATSGYMLVERFWRMRGVDDSQRPMQIVKRGKNFVELYASPYGASAVALRRCVTLPLGENCIAVKGTVSNLAPSEQKVQPWINVVPRYGKITRLVPAKGKVTQAAVGSVSRLAEDGIYSLSKERNVFLAPARNFMAVALHPENCTLAILPASKDLARSSFYMYNGTIARKKGSTIEYILADKRLKKGESFSYSYKIAVYKNMPIIRDIAGSIAIDAAVNGTKLTVKLASFRTKKNQKMQIKLTNRQGKVISLEKMTGTITPEKNVTLQFDLPQKADDSWNISGKIGENKFELLKLFLDKNTDLGENFKKI